MLKWLRVRSRQGQKFFTDSNKISKETPHKICRRIIMSDNFFAVSGKCHLPRFFRKMKMRPIRVLAIFSLIFSLSLSLKVDDDLELDLELIKHQPCLYREGRLLYHPSSPTTNNLSSPHPVTKDGALYLPQKLKPSEWEIPVMVRFRFQQPEP